MKNYGITLIRGNYATSGRQWNLSYRRPGEWAVWVVTQILYLDLADAKSTPSYFSGLHFSVFQEGVLLASANNKGLETAKQGMVRKRTKKGGVLLIKWNKRGLGRRKYNHRRKWRQKSNRVMLTLCNGSVCWNETSSMPKSVQRCLLNKESNFFSGNLNFLGIVPVLMSCEGEEARA